MSSQAGRGWFQLPAYLGTETNARTLGGKDAIKGVKWVKWVKEVK
jgi:hypothetical protein